MKVTPIDRRAHPAGATYSAWSAADGWLLRRMDWLQPPDSKPPGPIPRGSLIFAGGRGDFIEKYIEALAHWHRRGWNVCAFDWRGQGESRGTIVGGHLDSFDPLVADAAALIAEWSETHPGPRVAVGHSMGGHLLLRTIAEHRPPLDAAVLVAPMLGLNVAPLPAWLGLLAARAFAAFGGREKRVWKETERPALGSKRQAYLTSCGDRYADESWWKELQPGYDLGPPTWGWMNAAFDSIALLTPATLRTVKTPVLLIGTDSDRLVSPVAIRRAARLLPAADLFMFPSAAHELLRERDEVRLAALARIDSYLDEHASA